MELREKQCRDCYWWNHVSENAESLYYVTPCSESQCSDEQDEICSDFKDNVLIDQL
jgi:hypothetical protein